MEMTAYEAASREFPLATGEVALSGLMTQPVGDPRGLLVALPGGGSRARYFDSPVAPESSLLRLGASLGWRCLALDRPGYGSSAQLREERLDARAQAEMMLEPVLAEATGLPLLLVAHSMGAVAALRMAVELQGGDAARLIGVALGGAPLAYTPLQCKEIAVADLSGPTLRRAPGQRRRLPEEWLGPPDTYPAALLEAMREISDSVPSGEYGDALCAPERLEELLQKIEVPIQFVVAAHESTMSPPADVLAKARRVLPRTPGSEAWEMPASGHNLSLGHRARAFHLRLMAFAENCLALSQAAPGELDGPCASNL